MKLSPQEVRELSEVLKSPEVTGYRVYEALLTQNTITTTSGLLEVGKTYRVTNLLGADDFSNVGYANLNTNFVATGTTPTVWSNSSVVLNVTDSAPQAEILENTLTDIPVWTYNSAGNYWVTLNGEFTENKSAFISSSGQSNILCTFQRANANFGVITVTYDGAGIDGWLDSTYVKIKVKV